MADNNIEMQRIANDISRTFKQLTDTQREIREVLINLNGGPDKKRTKANGDPSPSASLSINRRLSGSIKALTKNVDDTVNQFGLLGRHLRGVNKRLSQLQKPTPAPTGTNNSSGNNSSSGLAQSMSAVNASNSLLITQIENLARVIQNNATSGNNDNNNNNNNNNQPNNDNGGNNDDEPKTRGWIFNAVQGFLSKYSAVSGIKKGYGELTSAASTGGIYNLSTQADAVMMGMDGQGLIELQSQHRASIMRATGGIDHWTDTIQNAQQGLLPFTGSLKEAAIVMASLQSNMLNLGFSFDEANSVIGDSRTGLIGNFKDLSSITGKTIAEISEAMNGIVSSDNGRDMLRKMDKSQRADYIQTQASLLKQYTHLTGNIDRAAQIINDQMQRTKIDPKTRYVQSVKVMQAAVHAGMGHGNAKRLQQLTAMNPRLLMQNPKLNTEFTKLRGDLHQNIKEMQGSPNFNKEWFGFFLEDMAGIAGMESSNTELDSPMSATNVAQQQERSISTLIDGNDILKESLTWLQRIHAGVESVIGLIALGTLGSLLGNLDNIKKLPSLFKSRTQPLPPGFMGPMPQSTQAAGSWFSSPAFTGSMAKIAKAGGVGVASLALSTLTDKLVVPTSSYEEGRKNVAMGILDWAGVGATIGTVIAPGIGTAVGAAIGGVAGAIIGSMEEVKNQQFYDSINSKKQFDLDMQILNSTHNVELSNIDEKIALERDAMRQKDKNEQEAHQQAIDNLLDEKNQRIKLFELQHAEATKLLESSSQLMAKTKEQDNVKLAINDSFELGTNLKDQFDTSEFLDKSKMTPEQLYSSVLTHVKDISTDQSRNLLAAFKDGNNIQDVESLNILRLWASNYQQKIASDIKSLTMSTEQQRKKTQDTNITDTSLFSPAVLSTKEAEIAKTNRIYVNTGFAGGAGSYALPNMSQDTFSKPIRPLEEIMRNSGIVVESSSTTTKKGSEDKALKGETPKASDDALLQVMRDQKNTLDLLVSTIMQQHKENRNLTVQMEDQRRFLDDFNNAGIPPLLQSPRRTNGHMK